MIIANVQKHYIFAYNIQCVWVLTVTKSNNFFPKKRNGIKSGKVQEIGEPSKKKTVCNC